MLESVQNYRSVMTSLQRESRGANSSERGVKWGTCKKLNYNCKFEKALIKIKLWAGRRGCGGGAGVRTKHDSISWSVAFAIRNFFFR